MNVENGVGDLLGNGVVGHSSLLLAKAPGRKDRNYGLRPQGSRRRVMF